MSEAEDLDQTTESSTSTDPKQEDWKQRDKEEQGNVVMSLQDGDSPLLRSGDSPVRRSTPDIWVKQDDFQYQDSVENEQVSLHYSIRIPATDFGAPFPHSSSNNVVVDHPSDNNKEMKNISTSSSLPTFSSSKKSSQKKTKVKKVSTKKKHSTLPLASSSQGISPKAETPSHRRKSQSLERNDDVTINIVTEL